MSQALPMTKSSFPTTHHSIKLVSTHNMHVPVTQPGSPHTYAFDPRLPTSNLGITFPYPLSNSGIRVSADDQIEPLPGLHRHIASTRLCIRNKILMSLSSYPVIVAPSFQREGCRFAHPLLKSVISNVLGTWKDYLPTYPGVVIGDPDTKTKPTFLP